MAWVLNQFLTFIRPKDLLDQKTADTDCRFGFVFSFQSSQYHFILD
jgi:hypothetical protein